MSSHKKYGLKLGEDLQGMTLTKQKKEHSGNGDKTPYDLLQDELQDTSTVVKDVSIYVL